MTGLLTVAPAPAALTPAGAKRLTEQLRAHLEGGWDLLTRAYISRVWELLDPPYPDWDSYLEGELGELRLIRVSRAQRAEIVASMVAAKMPYRAIANALGVSPSTVVADLDDLQPDRPRRRRRLRPVPDLTPDPPAQLAEPAELRVDERVYAAVAAQAEKGLTVHELCWELGMRQGAASVSLSRLHRRKRRIGPSGEFRDGCTVYVVDQ